MVYSVKASKRVQRKSNPRSRQTLQKPNGVISPRVKKVGGERFAIVCIDPAKHRSEWMMADYFGNILVKPQTLEHQEPHLSVAREGRTRPIGASVGGGSRRRVLLRTPDNA